MKVWIEVLLEWLNCLDVSERDIKNLKELDNGIIYKKLIKSFSWSGNVEDNVDTENIIVKFLQDEYPKCKFDDKILGEMEHIYVTSLFLLHVSQEPLFYHPMCINLQHETQLKIKSFLEMTIPYEKNIDREILKEIIVEIENAALKVPITPKTKTFKDFFNSPATWSAQSHKLLNERNRELRILKSELEVERFEKVDLQEDLRIQQNKIQDLQKQLQEKIVEIKALKEEKMKPTTPQSCKKNKNTIDYEQYYKKEIDYLEHQLIHKQCNIDKLEADNGTLTKKLTSIQTQCMYFKEKVENCEKSLENLQIQGEIKDRELVNLKMTNEELRTHLKEFCSKTAIEEQSFEIDGIAPLQSPSVSLNTSEVLSSVIDIQLQEAKQESALLKVQLDATNEKLQSASQKYENTIQLLEKKTQTLQNTETKLNSTVNELTKQIEILQKEKASLINQNKNLDMLCMSQKESLSHIEKSKNALITEKNSLVEKVKDLEESLNKKNINNVTLNTELTEVKSQISENLKYIQELRNQNNLYKDSADLYNINLKEIISDNIDYIEDNLKNKTTTELIEHLRIILSKFNTKYTLKQQEAELLNNDMNEAKLKLENFQLQISKLEGKDEQNNTEISKLKEIIRKNMIKISELTISIEKYTEEISFLKQIKFQKQALEKDLYTYKEKVNKKDSLLQTFSRCIEMLRKNIQTFETEFYLMKKDILNKINEYQKYNKETNESILNAYKMLYINYTEEQLCKNQLENELIDNKKELKDNLNFNVTLENDLIKCKERMNDLEAELIYTKQKLTEYTEKLKKFEETQQVFQKQHENLKSENEKILLDLNVVNDNLEKSQREVCNMLDELKFKNKKIEDLFEEITSLKLEKEHLIHLQTGGEIKMKNFIKELETKLLEKQHHSDQLNIEVKLKQERLEFVQNKFEKLSRETIASEMKLKEVIINLQEVRTNQDAVLKTQEKALKEKCLQLEQLQKEFNESKEVLCKQLENKKLLCQNLQSTNFKLETESCKQTKTIEELQQMLKKEKNELNKSKEYCKVEDMKKLEIIQTCEKLQHSVNDLKSTIAEIGTKHANTCIDTIYNIQNVNNDDAVENILKTIRTSINETHMSRKLILQLSNENVNLSESLKNLTTIEDNYVVKCEEIKLLKTKIQELNNLYKDRIKNTNILIKHKESLKDCLKNIIESREDLDTSLNRLTQKWNNLLTSSYSILIMDKSICDELKHIQTKKIYLEKALFKHHIHYFQNIKSLQNILWEQFSWPEQKIKDIWLEEKDELILDISSDVFFYQKTVIETELHKNEILQENIIQLQNEIDDFSKLVISFENDFKCDETKFQSEAEKKLQLQINELIEDKNNLESKLNCARIKNVKLENDVGEFSTKIQEIKITSLKEVEDLKKELTQLKEENSKLQEERDELSKRPKKEDVDKQLKDIYDKYEIKIDQIKQNMKTAYNEQITKLNREQEQCVQEKLESLQRKMELQCRKQADELSKYKTHVANMSSQLWTVGEKLLSEKQEKEKLEKELTELKAKYQNLDKKIISLIEHKNAKCEKKEALEENKDVLHKIAVIQEKTTYERRYSIRNIQTMGNAFNAEDEEGEVFDNIYLADMKDNNFSMSIDTDRLSILKKRNALCKPHLKSSYPAEMQFHPLSFTEEEIKAGSVTDEIFNDSLSQSLLPEQKAKKKDRTQTSYKKPGPPTPSKNGGRLSLQSNELRSPSSRILREKNKERATTTPRTLRNLFLSRGQDEKVIVTPRGRRRSSIFRKHRSANNR